MAKKNKKKENQPPPSRQEYPEVMTIDQVAEYLQLHKQVVYRHVKSNRIPASRIGSTLRFKKSVIDAWLMDSARESILPEREAPEEISPHPFNVEED